jgi:hypothetical protein
MYRMAHLSLSFRSSSSFDINIDIHLQVCDTDRIEKDDDGDDDEKKTPLWLPPRRSFSFSFLSFLYHLIVNITYFDIKGKKPI